MNTKQNASSRPVVGVMTGSFHTDYSCLVVDAICESLKDQEVDICLLQGLDASRFLNVDNYVDTGFDNHYYTQFEYANFIRPDLLVVSFCTISGVANPLPLEEFLVRLPQVPIILLEVEAALPNCMCITADNYNGMKECVNHLIEVHDCQSILFLGGPEGVPDADLRKNAWRDAMTEHGLRVTPEMAAHGNFTNQVDSAVEALLSRCPCPDAIVCANDEMAECAYRVLRGHGLEPGRDVAVTGFDDTAHGLVPTLTSVTQNVHEIARVLAESVRSALSGTLPKSVRVDTQVYYRRSCGCCDASLPDSGYSSPIASGPTGAERYKRLTQESMLSALMLRSLLVEQVNEDGFFRTLGSLLWSLNTPNSRLALLPEPVTVDRQRSKVVPPTLRVTMEQNHSQIRSFSRDSAPAVDSLKPFSTAQGQERSLTALFPLFHGSTHYGVFMVELKREDMVFYYTLSLEIGTGIRYLGLSLAQQETQAALAEKNQILNFSASHDSLTGLYNRAGLMNQIFNLLRTQSPGIRCALIMADLDHLKQINDTFGHGAGDEAIRMAAETLTRALPPESPLGRTGGDEFTAFMLLRDGISVESFQTRIKQEVEQWNCEKNTPWYLGISVGCSVFLYDNSSQISEHLELADQQLYHAKTMRRKNVIRTPSSKHKQES